MVRGAAAGILAAAVWAAAEPALGRVFRTSYSDVRLLRGLAGCSTSTALVLHLANGAVFGVIFERIGWRGVGCGVAAAELENLVLWPGMAIGDRVHPARRSGEWPPLLGNRRVFAYEVAAHGLFGAVLGFVALRAPRRKEMSVRKP
jgi:hypothetical protein